MEKQNKKNRSDGTTPDLEHDEDGVVDEEAAVGTALATKEDGVIADSIENMMDDLVSSGFQVVKTIKAGNPKTGCVPAYCGIILAKGAPVEAKLAAGNQTIKSEIASFAVHPAIPRKNADGSVTLTPNMKVTVRLIAPNQLAGDLESLLTKSNHLGCTGFFMFQWMGKGDIKGGTQQLNNFRFIELLGEKNDGRPVTLQPRV
jgi:hypothetical protein